MLPLTVCLIVKNEEKMLPECLDSVAMLDAEIIVVDTGSNDNTIELAKKKGAKVFSMAWEDDFSKARNFAISHSTRPLILMLDADERLVNPDALRSLCLSNNPNTGGWLVALKSVQNFKSGDKQSYKSQLLRLFRNHPSIRYEGIIHEQVVNSIKAIGMKIENSTIELIHLGYDATEEVMLKKFKRNLELLDKAISKDPHNSYNLSQRATTLNAMGRNREAHDDFLQALSLIPKGNQTRSRTLNYASINAFRLGLHDLSLNWALESYQLLPGQAFANFILAEIYFEKKEYKKAAEHYLLMKKYQDESNNLFALVSGDYNIPNDHLYYKIGRCYFLQNDYETAGNYYALSFKTNQQNVLGLIGLSNIAFNLRKYPEAKRLLETALEIDPSQEDIKYFFKQVDIALKGFAVENSNKSNAQAKSSKRLSVCMIVKNEEAMLEGCLESIKNVADEIIIVDTGSTDNTKAIAAKFNAKIYDFAWQNDFALARNESIKHSTGDWILYIDADERLAAESQAVIRTYIEEALPEIGGLLCTIESEHSQLDGSNELHRGAYPRLFRNLGYPKVKFTGRVHEQISPSIVDNKLNFAVSDIRIIHLGYNQTREVMEQKIKRNYTMLLAHVNEEPLNGYAWFQLGQTLGQMGLFKESEDALKFAINCGNLSDTILSSAAMALAQIEGNKGNYQESLEWAELSLSKAPEQIFTLALKGFALLQLGLPKAALETLQKALDLKLLAKTSLSSNSGGFDIELSTDLLQNGINKAKAMLNIV